MEISEIVDSVDILQYISQFCELTLQRDGEYWGLSPLKHENTPSFSVNTGIQRFYDFSSGRGGNVLDFVRAYYGCGVRRGIEILREYANIPDDGNEPVVTRLLSTSIAQRYRQVLRKQHESKGVILPGTYMDRFDFNEEKLAGWKGEGICDESLKRFQVRYDPVSDRLVFPIRNLKGDIVNVCGRTLDPNFKAKRLRKYTYFKPLGVLDLIYGLHENRKEIVEKREIILFEGAKSVMLADTWGIRNTGAVLTSHLNRCQFDILVRLGVRVTFALDAEVDIRQDENIMRLRRYTEVYWVRNIGGVLDEKDAPVDKGREVFERLYEERRRLR